LLGACTPRNVRSTENDATATRYHDPDSRSFAFGNDSCLAWVDKLRHDDHVSPNVRWECETRRPHRHLTLMEKSPACVRLQQTVPRDPIRLCVFQFPSPESWTESPLRPAVCDAVHRHASALPPTPRHVSSRRPDHASATSRRRRMVERTVAAEGVPKV
jgi:hypothetical protein